MPEAQPSPLFPLQLLQAVNDWQIGPTAKVKRKRAEKLQRLTKSCDQRFRLRDRVLYRRIALSKKSVFEFGTRLKLSEHVSSWTLDLDIAKRFKGGVPDSDEIGIIVELLPQHGSVVLNLQELYSDPEFVKACAYHANEIKNFHRGIGKWWDSQHEVVLECGNVELDCVRAIGGWSTAVEPAESIASTIGILALDGIQSIRSILRSRDGDGSVPRWITNHETIGRLLAFWTEQAEKLQALSNGR